MKKWIAVTTTAVGVMTVVYAGFARKEWLVLTNIWTFIGTMQVLHLLVYSALSLPIFVRDFFSVFDFANLLFLPNFFSDPISEDGDAPSAFEEEDADNNFLLNCG
jgi:hypothetical protein